MMRALSLLLSVVAASLWSVAAAAELSDADALRQFGMLGTNAVDCNAPPSAINPHDTYAVDPAGQVIRTLRMGDSATGETFKIRNVRLIGSEFLEFVDSGRQSEVLVLIARIDGKTRSWRSESISGNKKGEVLIDKGIIKGNGEPTLALTFCHAK
jgi:hypothetical protein